MTPLEPYERDWFGLRGWRKRQHYADRNPPWIKLYSERLNDYSFCCLPDAAKAHLVGIELLASRKGNLLPWDEEWIGCQISATERVQLALLENFIWKVRAQSEAHASNLLALC